MVGELEMRRELAVEQEGRADAGPERDDELQPRAAHDSQALQVGVVGDPHRMAETFGHHVGQVESRPGRHELRDDLGARTAIGSRNGAP